MIRCRDIGAVDMMCYLWSPEYMKTLNARLAADPRYSGLPEADRGLHPYTTKQYVAMMDKVGINKSIIATAKMWELKRGAMYPRLRYEEEDVYQWIKSAPPGRMYGLAGYDPFHIMESVTKIEKAVKEWGFRGVFYHPQGYGLDVDDRKWYPLYETCAALDVPVQMQVGHTGNQWMPSRVGHPMLLDEVALDFPDLIIIGSHTGFPWSDELISMVRKQPNVYLDIAGWPPKWLQPWLVRWINKGCREKTMWGTTEATIERAEEYFDQLDELLVEDETKRLILRENAMRVFKL